MIMVKLLAPKRNGYFWAKLFVWLPGRGYMAWVFLAEFGYNFSSLLLEKSDINMFLTNSASTK